MSLTLKQLAAHILSLPDDVQEQLVYVDDDARLLPVSAERPLVRMYRDSVGYKHGMDPETPHLHHHYSEDERAELQLVHVLTGEC